VRSEIFGDGLGIFAHKGLLGLKEYYGQIYPAANKKGKGAIVCPSACPYARISPSLTMLSI
jgi:hypothetical protein